mgnify:CR=1 FL=1
MSNFINIFKIYKLNSVIFKTVLRIIPISIHIILNATPSSRLVKVIDFKVAHMNSLTTLKDYIVAL